MYKNIDSDSWLQLLRLSSKIDSWSNSLNCLHFFARNMYRCTKNTPQIAMHVSTLIHSQLLFKVAEVNPCRLCGQTNFRNLTDDFFTCRNRVVKMATWVFFQRKKREHVTKSSSKTQKKLLPKLVFAEGCMIYGFKRHGDQNKPQFYSNFVILCIPTMNSWKVHKFELPFCMLFHSIWCWNSDANIFWKKDIWLLDNLWTKNMLHTKKKNTQRYFLTWRSLENPHVFWEYMSTQ